MVGTDESTELWRHPVNVVVGSGIQTYLSTIGSIGSLRFNVEGGIRR